MRALFSWSRNAFSTPRYFVRCIRRVRSRVILSLTISLSFSLTLSDPAITRVFCPSITNERKPRRCETTKRKKKKRKENARSIPLITVIGLRSFDVCPVRFGSASSLTACTDETAFRDYSGVRIHRFPSIFFFFFF